MHDIEDIWSMLAVSSYWRSGPVLNNAISGIDMALWDIKGKLAGMPLYDLLGGRCRTAATVYVHASGRDPAEVEDEARRFMEEGFTHVRCQVAVPGASTYGVDRRARQRRSAPGPSPAAAGGVGPGRLCPRRARPCSSTCAARSATVSSCCTTSTSGCRPSPPSAWRRRWSRTGSSSSKIPSRPEDNGYFPLLRQQTAIPLAMGELLRQRQRVPAADPATA